MSRQPRFWGFRTDKNTPREYYNDQLESRLVLRQGWGWDENQDLRKMADVTDIPRDQRPNVRMYRNVKKGDFILVPRPPEWGQVTVAQAKEDWDTGYQFEVDEFKKDFGHQFPAKKLAHFNPNNKHVDGDIRQTLKCRLRFWNVDRFPNQCGKSSR